MADNWTGGLYRNIATVAVVRAAIFDSPTTKPLDKLDL
jgi:hypothetical protein